MALFKHVDAVVLAVPNLEDGIKFYCDKLGHELKWRDESSAGLKLGESELVLSTKLTQETDILVESVEDAIEKFNNLGGEVIVEPEDIPVGKVTVVKDPFGNALTLVDLSKGTYSTDAKNMVTGIEPTA